MNNNKQIKYQTKTKYTPKITKDLKSKQYQPAPGKNSMNKWAANEQQWGGKTGQINSNPHQIDINKKKINLNGLVERMMGTSSSEFETKIMQDWMKTVNLNKGSKNK